jgi:hypothetical protein
MVQGPEGLVLVNIAVHGREGHPAEAQGADVEAVAKVN